MIKISKTSKSLRSFSHLGIFKMFTLDFPYPFKSRFDFQVVKKCGGGEEGEGFILIWDGTDFNNLKFSSHRTIYFPFNSRGNAVF